MSKSTTIVCLIQTFIMLMVGANASAQTEADSLRTEDMDDVVVKARQSSKMDRIDNAEMIGPGQLVRAACCNLGESFTTNPSVDVNYSDAATGARQIKLLGLSGTYVQMLTENVPNLRGAAIPFGLGYVPGPWMYSIQVSKGASSVRNGYESTTGQINIEYLKPQSIDQVSGNLYYDIRQKLEANVMANIHSSSKFSHGLLMHYEDRQHAHDGNGDGFLDMPKVRQYNGMYRAAYFSPRWISQLYVKMLRENRVSGEVWTKPLAPSRNLYNMDIQTTRMEGQWKNALILDTDHNTSVALMLHASQHLSVNEIGLRNIDVTQHNGYAQLMYETDLTPEHNLSVGASLNHDKYSLPVLDILSNGCYFMPASTSKTYDEADQKETTKGLYAQYTYKLDEKLSLMAGLRWDHSNLYGGFWTPRLHARYTPAEWLTLRASAGKGYRSPHALIENISLMATGRDLVFESRQRQEQAWNYGLCSSFSIPLGERELELNAEYYYTDFKDQLIIDPYSNAEQIIFSNLQGRSYSHTLQIDANIEPFSGLDVTAGFRFSDAQTCYNGKMQWRPLTARYKGMLALSYKTPLEFWHFDVTGQLIGPSMLYDGSKTPTYGQLNAQITREFRFFSIYIGGENLTNYMIPDPIRGASNPWSRSFDATQVWGPTEGAMAYIGIRFKLEKDE